MSKRVLIVDDNEDAADAVAALLESVGHEARTANNGRAALEEAKRWLPDAMILDIGLPDMDGYELARAVTAEALMPAPRLIALSGYGAPRDLQRAREAGFAHHLLKPADPDALFALIEEAEVSG